MENWCKRIGWEKWVKGVGNKMLLKNVWKHWLARLVRKLSGQTWRERCVEKLCGTIELNVWWKSWMTIWW